MSVIVFSSKPYDKDFFEAENAAQQHGFELIFLEGQLNEVTVQLLPTDQSIVAVCVFVNDIVNAAVLDKLAERGVKNLALRCAGFNNVDLAYAKEKGIVVSRVDAYSPECVAEMAMALIMTLNRKTHKAYNRVREQNFSLVGLLGFNIHGKTIGVVGTGKIGLCFVRIARGYGAKVIVYDPYPNPKIAELCGEDVKYATLDEIYAQSDIISLHCPLTKENHHLIDENAIAKMKKNVMIINTSRGGLIKTKAVIAGLKTGAVGYLGIDVYEHEEHCFYKDLSGAIIEDDEIQRLVSFPNVVLTSHQAFFTKEALEQISSITLRNIKNVQTTGTTDAFRLL